MIIDLKDKSGNIIAEFDINNLNPSNTQPDYNIIMVTGSFNGERLPREIFNRSITEIEDGRDMDFTIHILTKKIDISLEAKITFKVSSNVINVYHCPTNGKDSEPANKAASITIKPGAAYVHRGSITFSK